MSTVAINGSATGTALQSILSADDIQPGSEPSYQLCKTIYLTHPLGAKMVENPVRIAQSKEREISIPHSPESIVKEAFVKEWKALKATELIRGVMFQARIYGIGSVVYGAPNIKTDEPIDPWDLSKLDLYFNILDPLNTAGSLVLNQNPNSPDYQKPQAITAAGQAYHRSRSLVMLNEMPIYIAYTHSAFGFVGRSVYQRALYPLKSFIQSMITDDMVTKKAGLLVAALKNAGSIINNLMMRAAGVKRSILKDAQTDNVISIDVDETITAIDLTNTDTAMTTARKNIIENIATAAPMPAKMLLSESFAEGFGEGTEDAKAVIQYINGVRDDMAPLYEFFDHIVMFRAWTPEFYRTVQTSYPEEYLDKDYKTAFYEWKNNFTATWPSLIEEPESELQKVDETKLKGITEMLTVMLLHLDPQNKATLIGWACDNVSEMKRMFSNALTLDLEALENYEPPTPPQFGADGDDNQTKVGEPGKLKAVA